MQIALPLLLGLSVFLTGMKVMELALHQWAGSYLISLVERFTRTPLRGMLVGTGVTMVLQSSSAITVLTIGLVNAGIMTFPRTLGIILGTNIGTCITTELIGLNITSMGLPLIIMSAGVWIAALLPAIGRDQLPVALHRILHHIRSLSLAAAGFGSILLGVEVMQSVVPALQSRGLFGWFIDQAQRNAVWGVMAGAVLTAIIQSGTATIAMAMGLATVDAIPVELGIAIVLGANIGTCLTAFLASIGGTKSGVLVAWSHIILNAGGVLLFLPFLPQLHFVSELMANSPSEQIARAQTVFNIVCSLIALPICYLPAMNKLGISSGPRS